MIKTAITFDIDWAPDWCVELCAEMCVKAGIPATYFATHQTPILSDLAAEPSIEVGIHPNFLASSTHGDSIENVMEHMLELIPTAESMRTHSLKQSTIIFEKIVQKFPMIKNDVSLLILGQNELIPFKMPIAESGKFITRLPYIWEDDVAALDKMWHWTSALPRIAGINIFAFHPIHVALNSSDLSAYQALREETKTKSLHLLKKQEVEKFKQNMAGTQTKLLELLSENSERQFSKIATMAAKFAVA